MTNETAFSMETSSIKYGPGVTREVGYEMRRLGARRVMVVTDPRMAQSEATAVTIDSLRAEGIDTVLYDRGARGADGTYRSGRQSSSPRTVISTGS